MKYMLDTNICIHLIQRHPAQLLARLAQEMRGDVVMSSITYAELRAGLELRSEDRQRDEAALRALATRIPVQPFHEAAAESYGLMRKAIPDRRRDALDRLIAAHAASLDLILVTNNLQDFRDYPGIHVENWVSG
jgi:tRNA(fMet)-specific endonuclease VapC